MRLALPLMIAPLLAASAPPAERVVEPGGTVAVTIDGVPARLRIEPGAPGLPLLARAEAERRALRCSGLLCFGIGYRIGRERVDGQSARVRFGWGDGAPERRRIGWMTRDYAMGADGTIGPGGLPEPVVRLVLRAPRPGERALTLRAEGGGLFGEWKPVRAEIVVGGEKIAVRFDPSHPRSLATAGAAATIAAAHGGTLTEMRGTQEVMFGVERPFRVMALARPLGVGPLALSTLGVRVSDGNGAQTIREEGADPSEVLVAPRGKKTYRVLSLGADVLDRCSSIVFDKPAKAIRLTCG